MTTLTQKATGALAIQLMIGASALVAATSLIAKALGLGVGDIAGLSPFQVSAGRFTFALCALLVVFASMPKIRPGFRGANWRLHLGRSMCGWLGITAMFAAVARMPVADATAISFLSPIFGMGLAVVMLGERLGPRKLMAAGLALVGALLILRPGTDTFQIAGFLALAAAALMGLEMVFIKRLSDSEPAMRVLLINNTIGAVISVTAASFVWVWPTASQWLLLICLGAIMVSAQSLFIQSMKRGEASFVMPAFYSVLLFAAVFDFAIFGVIPATAAMIGAAFIIAGALILAIRVRR